MAFYVITHELGNAHHKDNCIDFSHVWGFVKSHIIVPLQQKILEIGLLLDELQRAGRIMHVELIKKLDTHYSKLDKSLEKPERFIKRLDFVDYYLKEFLYNFKT